MEICGEMEIVVASMEWRRSLASTSDFVCRCSEGSTLRASLSHRCLKQEFESLSLTPLNIYSFGYYTKENIPSSGVIPDGGVTPDTFQVKLQPCISIGIQTNCEIRVL